jgi:hypothetical protein
MQAFFLLSLVFYAAYALDPTSRREFTRLQNAVRSAVAKGQQASANGSRLPAAKNMYALVGSFFVKKIEVSLDLQDPPGKSSRWNHQEV